VSPAADPALPPEAAVAGDTRPPPNGPDPPAPASSEPVTPDEADELLPAEGVDGAGTDEAGVFAPDRDGMAAERRAAWCPWDAPGRKTSNKTTSTSTDAARPTPAARNAFGREPKREA